ncbi:MAG: patatin-like phospholipase family protein [Gammaproteobacteria bacterium]|uniref:patatin-like phospholipase family protein n=1 Tax=Pseudomaricurvus alcaniphilus TaxID=1166482 RepID=UPI00140B16CB|nr:patatin-like phospholipase family protein [Pseudomaricurvus alcaniphilus]MBR9912877.1 patatin-like phospholipase family protein [Gammaproteobacteria bacterium]NHN38646.1 patatin-like phospholipase family protein [Pseudomaricurvus alcaniphilus]
MAKLILSLDGGGVRGAASARFLTLVEDELQRNHARSLRDCVDLYAGTSTGSIIALALATTDLSVEAISDLYNVDTARKIFKENRGLFEIDGLNAPKYEGKGKTKVLRDNFGSAKVGDVAAGKHVLVVGYAIEKRKPEVIKSTTAEFRGLASYKVADASSAAPTYFPTQSIEMGTPREQNWLVDGGVTANNPTMCAIAEIRHAWSDTSLDDVRVLSIGTGYRTRKINGPDSRGWGAVQWFTQGRILEVLTDERVVAYQAMAISRPGSYIRVNADMCRQPGLPNPPDDAMDDISRKNINRLKAMGEFWFERYGASTVQLLLNTYQGPSLDRIDPATGQPWPQTS